MKRLTSVQFRLSAETADAVLNGKEADDTSMNPSAWGRAECPKESQVTYRNALARRGSSTTSARLLLARRAGPVTQIVVGMSLD